MTLEQLLALENAPTLEQAKLILELFRKSIDGNYVPKDTFNAELEKSKGLKEQLTDRDKQITELGAFKGTAEQLQNKVIDLTTANETTKNELETKYKELQQKTAVKFIITDKVIDVDDVLPKLDFSKLTFDGDKVKSGLDEQIAELQKSKPHYFKTAEQTKKPDGWVFGNKPKEGTDNKGSSNVDDATAYALKLADNKLNTSIPEDKNPYFK